MSQETYEYLIYDKASGSDHGYNNPMTKNETLEKVFTSNFKCYENMEAIREFNKFGDIYVIPLNLNLELYNIYLFDYDIEKIKIKITVVAVHKQYLEYLVKNKKDIPNKQFLLSLCNYNLLYNKGTNGINIVDKYALDKKIKDRVAEVIKIALTPNEDETDPVILQPPFAKVSLFEFQKKSIKWMIDRENEASVVYYNINDETIIGNVVCDAVKHDFMLAYDRLKLVFKGGALIDEMGLGKTYQTIILSLCNQAKNINYYQPGINRLCSKATLIICPNQIPLQWISEIAKMIDKKYNVSVIPFFGKPHLDKYTYQDLLDADFVITSFPFLLGRPFLSTWMTDVGSKKISTKDISVMSNDLMKDISNLAMKIKVNKSSIFDHSPNIMLIHWHRLVVDEIHGLFEQDSKLKPIIKLLQNFSASNKWGLSATPFEKTADSLVGLINYVTNYVVPNDTNGSTLLNNNVYDHVTKRFFRRNTKMTTNEEHQLPPLKENVIWLNFSKTEWMMYTAFKSNPTIDKFNVLLRQICCHPKIANEIKGVLSNCKTLQDIEQMMLTHYESQMKDALVKFKYMEYKIRVLKRKIKIAEWKRQKYYLKQKKYRVKVEFNDKLEKFSIKDYDVNHVDFTELNIDNNVDNNDNIYNMDNPFSDDDDDNDRKKPLIVISDENQEKIKKILGDKIDEDTVAITNMKEYGNTLNDKLTIIRNDYNGKKSTYDYYKNVMDRLAKTSNFIPTNSDSDDDNDENEVCGCCMGQISKNDLGVTVCGHIYCYNCIKPFVDEKRKCPYCGASVQPNEIYMITKPMPEEIESKEFKDKQTLITKVGTKLANLIFFLKSTKKHAIIFSQWDDLLRKVGDVLNEYGIKNVFCKGSSWQRGKAISDFNSDNNIRVIMLSSERAASGTNLTKAELVIFLDPVSGDYEYRTNVERQAIGRAYRMGQTKQVDVIRFIIKNTVEEEIYLMNKAEDKKVSADMKIFEFSENNINLDKTKIDELVEATKEAEKRKIEKLNKKTDKKEIKTN